MDEAHPSHPHGEEGPDFAELFGRLKRGLLSIVGLSLLGLALGIVAYFIFGPFQVVTTSSRVVFSFPGFEKGEYPDKSKFQPDDLRSPEIVAEALKQQGLEATEETQSKVRAALTIEGIIPDSVIKERDKLRASGQTPRPYVPDEYALTLSLPRQYPLTARQRELLLNNLVSIYQEKFTRTYVALPMSIGKAFETLRDADYFDYDIVLSRESQNLTSFLEQMIESGRAFRSPRNGLSFTDLQAEAQIFIHVRLNEMLGVIRRNGLSRNRSLSLVKMEYYIRTLTDDENRAIEEEKVVQALLKQAWEREQNYTLGVKSQTGTQRNDNLTIDQGLVDSLLANDAYNFLVRKSLDASLKTRRIQSDKAVVQERLNDMQAFIKSDVADKATVLTEFQEAFDRVKKDYSILMKDIELTYVDFERQQYGDAIQVSMQARTQSFYRGAAVAGIAGLVVSLIVGLGLTLLGIELARRQIP